MVEWVVGEMAESNVIDMFIWIMKRSAKKYGLLPESEPIAAWSRWATSFCTVRLSETESNPR